MNNLLADSSRRSSSLWPSRKKEGCQTMTVFSQCKSASLHQLPDACTNLPWLQTGLHMQGRYWSGEEHWQFVSYQWDDLSSNYLGISLAHAQLSSGAGTLPHQPSFSFFRELPEGMWLVAMNRGSLTSHRKSFSISYSFVRSSVPSHSSKPEPDPGMSQRPPQGTSLTCTNDERWI